MGYRMRFWSWWLQCVVNLHTSLCHIAKLVGSVENYETLATFHVYMYYPNLL